MVFIKMNFKVPTLEWNCTSVWIETTHFRPHTI